MNAIYPKISLLENFKEEESQEVNLNNNASVKDDIINYIKKLIETDNIEPSNLTNYGIDSMMAMEYLIGLKKISII